MIDLEQAVRKEEERKQKYAIITKRYHQIIPHMTKLLK